MLHIKIKLTELWEILNISTFLTSTLTKAYLPNFFFNNFLSEPRGVYIRIISLIPRRVITKIFFYKHGCEIDFLIPQFELIEN